MPGVKREAPRMASSGVHYAVTRALAGGVDLSDGLSDGKCREIRNMHAVCGELRTRQAVKSIPDAAANGSVHAYIAYEGRLVFHAGDTLYDLDGQTLYTRASGLPDSDGVFVPFGDKLYLYVGTYIYSLTPEGVCTEEVPYCPRYTDTLSTAGEPLNVREDFTPNIASPYLSAKYNVCALTSFSIPNDMDTTRAYYLERDGERLTEEHFTLTDGHFVLDAAPNESLVVGYCSTREEIVAAAEGMASCTLGASYGGGTLDGTYVILSGGAERGKYYVSAAADPLSFTEADTNTVAAGAEAVTALHRQGAYLLLFTERAVYRVNYVFDTEVGGYFTVQVIVNTVGCLAPRSVASVGERTVFAASDGVYIIESTALYDVMSAVKLSANIESGEDGYLCVPKETLQAASASVCDGEYLLHVGNMAYVWSYGENASVGSGDTDKAARKLVWFLYDSLPEGVTVEVSGKRYVLVGETSEGVTSTVIYAYGGGDDGCTHWLRTGRLTFDEPYAMKRLTGVYVDGTLTSPTVFEAVVRADGVPCFRHTETVTPDDAGHAVFAFRHPGFYARGFELTLEIHGTDAALSALRIDYITAKGK